LSSEVTLAPKEGKYLTFMYKKQVEEDTRVRTTILAKSFKVNPATATEVFQKLAEKKLIEYTRYYGAKLTQTGIAEAQKLLRKHRILEVFFVKFLKYNAAKACAEASIIDHYCSEDLINAICRTYGHPKRCPCNKVIFSNPKCRRQN
jgi:DtxR family Mn-dependent transcriptional regulator